MADLIAIGYPDETTATAASLEADRLAKDLIDLVAVNAPLLLRFRAGVLEPLLEVGQLARGRIFSSSGGGEHLHRG